MNSEKTGQKERSETLFNQSFARRSRLQRGLNGLLTGQINARTATLEVIRRRGAKAARRRERASVEKLAALPAQLLPEFSALSPVALLSHFRERSSPSSYIRFKDEHDLHAQQALFAVETARLLDDAKEITLHRWPLLGFGVMDFGETINWHRDPLSGRIWPLEYHADICLRYDDGSDVRVLWEQNRLGHLLTLGRAYALTHNDDFARQFFIQIESWRKANPVGRGVNWSCAMEVALRAMNVLAALDLFRDAQALDEDTLMRILAMLDQHGAHISRNLEFSYLRTSNHYLSDVVGLLWLGILLPELAAAKRWRDWALREMLNEMDRQVLSDGADFEASTGYHRFVLELFLYSFILCRRNGIVIDQEYWERLRSMLRYIKAYMRPDGRAPLIGDTDSGRVVPLACRIADDHSHLLSIGAVLFEDAGLKPVHDDVPEEVLWLFGHAGVDTLNSLQAHENDGSEAFPEAGTYILHSRDLYCLFNTNGAGINGRGSHAHNDALSIEISACNRSFIVDPGTFVYTANLKDRHQFRSTAYHSTIMLDRTDQNRTDENAPFEIGNDAHPRVHLWESSSEVDKVVAEHHGYRRLGIPADHRRSVTFFKADRWWLIEDEISSRAQHQIDARFHFAPGLSLTADEGTVIALDPATGARLIIKLLNQQLTPVIEDQFSSIDYGSRKPSLTACWRFCASSLTLSWALVPICPGETSEDRLKLTTASAQ
ncbi:MAG: alginate lyase family protein [Pyrinomonadaceae bacterium]